MSVPFIIFFPAVASWVEPVPPAPVPHPVSCTYLSLPTAAPTVFPRPRKLFHGPRFSQLKSHGPCFPSLVPPKISTVLPPKNPGIPHGPISRQDVPLESRTSRPPWRQTGEDSRVLVPVIRVCVFKGKIIIKSPSAVDCLLALPLGCLGRSWCHSTVRVFPRTVVSVCLSVTRKWQRKTLCCPQKSPVVTWFLTSVRAWVHAACFTPTKEPQKIHPLELM